MRRQRLWFLAVGCAAAIGCGGDDGSGQDGTDEGGCPDGVCLPTESPNDDGDDDDGDDGNGTNDGPDDGPNDGTADGETRTEPPDGVCDPTACDPWDIASPADGTAQRSCQDPDCPTTADLPDLDEDFFKCQVMPVFQEGCANLGCHSPLTPSRQLRLYARFQARELPMNSGSQDEELVLLCEGGNFHSATCARHPITETEWATNFDSARLFALGVEDTQSSELLTQPLANDAAGLEHAGIDNWAGTNDVRYQTIQSWLDGATEQAGCVPIGTPQVVGSEDNTVGGYFQFSCPQCNEGGNCVDSGETAPLCDPNACLP
ncbi:MAG: hypothetical protein JKY37_02120 [Nannocystaceae bacterium]|nr:hypothetical protein [Nannocystaceae bacterium]